MLNIHKYSLLTVVAGFFVVFGCRQSIAMAAQPEAKGVNITTNSSDTTIGKNAVQPIQQAKAVNSTTNPSNAAVGKNAVQPTQPAQFCPQAEELIKQGDMWVTRDNRWKNFTHSSASKIVSFLGAQWVGVKVGKIICLYQTNEAVSFPLAVEQLSSQSILEPNKSGWSALVNNRRFCKSASVADCVYFAEPQKDISNIYQEIKYNPSEARAEQL